MDTVGDSGAESNSAEKPKDPVATAELDMKMSAPIWSPCKWLTAMEGKKRITRRRLTQTISAVKSLYDAMAFDPDDIPKIASTELFRENIEDVVAAWHRVNPTKEEKTARDYRTKALWLVSAFEKRCAGDPEWERMLAKFAPGPRNGHGGNGTAKTKRVPKRAPRGGAVPVPTPPSSVPEGGSEIVFSLGGHRVRMVLPFAVSDLTADHIGIIAAQLASGIEDFSVRDAGLIGSQLATRGRDFNPLEPLAVQMFASSSSGVVDEDPYGTGQEA